MNNQQAERLIDAIEELSTHLNSVNLNLSEIAINSHHINKQLGLIDGTLNVGNSNE